MPSRIKILEACVRSRLLYSAQSQELSASELRKLESTCHGFLRKMITNRFKRKNDPLEYLKSIKEAKKSNTTVPESGDLNWAHVRLDNFSFQKQLLFSCEHKKYSRDRWVKMEKEQNISKMQIHRMMQKQKRVHDLTISNLHKDT